MHFKQRRQHKQESEVTKHVYQSRTKMCKMFENKTLGEKEAKLSMLVFSMLRILEKFNLNALKNKLKEDMSNIGKMYN